MSTPAEPSPTRRPSLFPVALALGVLGLAGVGAALIWMPGTRTMKAQSRMAKPVPAPIDGERAYGYLKAICAIGPRTAGSAANTRQRMMVAEHFRKHGGATREQPFQGTDPISRKPVSMANLIGSWYPERAERVVIAAHYDTRPFPDEDRNPTKRQTPFLGANDGASGVALLMEIAHHLGTMPTPWGVDLVLFDGEELVYGGGRDQIGEYFLGAKEFARSYVEDPKRKVGGEEVVYAAGLVLDMVGDRNLQVDKEPHSLEFAPGLVRDVWAVARALNVKQFRDRTGPAVLDDHLALNNGGIPSIDIIDFDYPHWHTAQDVPENCSGASLEQVGKVVTGWLNQPKPRSPR
ncbi:M28 family peptidase [Tundrisphaera sp. TA3]|uniref:M28 family peptidase n=1 Tax=Tundrisphaera sp. TA3 TaxID=3435775 RepID=UPI003EBE60AF